MIILGFILSGFCWISWVNWGRNASHQIPWRSQL